MDEKIFSGLENLGFEDITDLNLYKKKNTEKTEKDVEKDSEDKEKNLLYDATVTCPVCGTTFKARAVKTSSYRVSKKDSDFFIRYSLINPYFYDVWLCNSCGFAAMKRDFYKIKSYQCEAIREKIIPKWKGKSYPEIYDVNIAIERYKLALLNACVIEAKSSQKAMICLKIAWMYRLIEDSTNELVFLKQALEGFNDAYFNEDFPLYEMDKFVSMYLLGELSRRVGKDEEAMQWFSKLITAPNAPQKIKEMARDQKDLIKDNEKDILNDNEDREYNEDVENNTPEKKGFFSKFFK